MLCVAVAGGVGGSSMLLCGGGLCQQLFGGEVCGCG